MRKKRPFASPFLTLVLLVLTVFSIVTNIPAVKRARDRRKAARQK